MKKYLRVLLMLLFGLSLFSDIAVAIYVLPIAVALLTAAKFSWLLGCAVISLAILRLIKIRLDIETKEEG